ncbi:hypothetical protein PIB30_095673, partial [Stylosanthes scabra]|nr:hypothetical protein [Stylosanthes scabra]
MKPLGVPRTRSGSFHVTHKVLVGVPPYIRAKNLQDPFFLLAFGHSSPSDAANCDHGRSSPNVSVNCAQFGCAQMEQNLLRGYEDSLYRLDAEFHIAGRLGALPDRVLRTRRDTLQRPHEFPGSTLGEQASSMWRTCLNGITIGRWHPHWWSD